MVGGILDLDQSLPVGDETREDTGERRLVALGARAGEADERGGLLVRAD
jgi:hypothetical protein